MSAFVCILDRRGRAVTAAGLDRLAEPLGGAPAMARLCLGPVGIALRSQFAPAADAARRAAPLTDPESGMVGAVAGRFHAVARGRDSRERPRPDPPERVGGAAWMLERWRSQGAGALAGVAGSFAAIVADPARGRLSVARAHLGDLKVYYHLDPHWLIAASEPTAILRHPAVGGDLDPCSASRFLAFSFGHSERSFFREIQELAPAHCLTVSSSEAATERYWRFDRLASVRRLGAHEVRTGVAHELAHSIEHQEEGIAPRELALSLSGGLDSTAIAAQAPAGMRAFSWRFERRRDDERERIEEVSRHLGLDVQWIEGDGCEPLCGDFEERFVHASSPYLNAFAGLKARLYEVARAEGCKRVLVGDGGDVPYAAREYWLRDALTSGRGWAWPSLVTTAGRALRGEPFARLSLRRLIPVGGVRRTIGRTRLPWLTAEAHSLLPRHRASPILPPSFAQRRYDLAVGAKHVEIESEERRLFDRCGLERGNPFWYWPLLELAIQLPAYWYHRDGVDKVLARELVRGRIPERVVDGEPVGSLGGFFLDGIRSQRESVRERVFERPRSDWQRFVRREWLERTLEETSQISFGHTILWRVISYELWCRRLGH
ncbi:MAG TPA: asparagine synthetase B family protein [Thermoanaerobaculia bacterium]|nr:asparagine synthetase B family protein [Thermoanaerobaculia bacterium]